jgi:hypothetical protein
MTVKKVIIEKKDFPPLSPDGEYLLKYRILSEDKNRTSHWSPIYKLSVARVWDKEEEEFVSLIKPVFGDLQISNADRAINTFWEASAFASSYDVFVSFGIYNVGTSAIAWGSYAYHGSSNSTSYSFLRPDAVTDIRVKIQLSGIEKEVNPTLTICTLEKSRR